MHAINCTCNHGLTITLTLSVTPTLTHSVTERNTIVTIYKKVVAPPVECNENTIPAGTDRPGGDGF